MVVHRNFEDKRAVSSAVEVFCRLTSPLQLSLPIREVFWTHDSISDTFGRGPHSDAHTYDISKYVRSNPGHGSSTALMSDY